MAAGLTKFALLARLIFKSTNEALLKSAVTPSLPENDDWLEEQVAEPEKLKKFHRLVHWPEATSQFLHPCYPQILAFPSHLKLLSQADFPFKPLGLVHISNQIEQLRGINVDESFTIRSSLANVAKHRLGFTFELVTELWINKERVWWGRGKNLFRYAHQQAEVASSEIKASDHSEPLVTEQWSLESSLGRRYAKASGDFNPIHLYPLSAKMLGFKGHIAHGMWSKSRCLSALHESSIKGFKVDVKFQKPIFLPAKVQLNLHKDGDPLYFSLKASEQGESHLSGALIKQ